MLVIVIATIFTHVFPFATGQEWREQQLVTVIVAVKRSLPARQEQQGFWYYEKLKDGMSKSSSLSSSSSTSCYSLLSLFPLPSFRKAKRMLKNKWMLLGMRRMREELPFINQERDSFLKPDELFLSSSSFFFFPVTCISFASSVPMRFSSSSSKNLGDQVTGCTSFPSPLNSQLSLRHILTPSFLHFFFFPPFFLSQFSSPFFLSIHWLSSLSVWQFRLAYTNVDRV